MSGPNPVYVDFVVRGMDNVLKAIKSVSDAVTQTERTSVAAAKASANAKSKEAERAARDQIAAWKRADTMIAAAHRAGAAEAEKRFKSEATSAKKAAQEQISAWKSADREISKARRAGEAEARKIANAEASEAKKVANAKVSAARQAANQIAREENKIQLEILRGKRNALPSLSPQAQLAVLRSARGGTTEEQRQALAHVAQMRARAEASNKEAKDRANALDAAARQQQALHQQAAKRELALKEQTEAEKATITRRWQMRAENEEFTRRKQFAQNVLNAGGTAVKNATTVAGNVGKHLFGMVTEAGGGFSVQDAIQQRMATDKEWALVGVNAVDPVTGKQLHPDMAKARAKARETSIRTNTNELDLAKGIQVYQGRAGEVESGLRNLDFFAKTSKTMGESVETVMEMGGQLRAQNKSLDDAGMRKLILDTMQQARVTSLNPVELAKMAGKATAGAVDWAGNQADNQRRMLGLVGYTAPVAGSAAEAATAVNSLSQDANQNRDAVEKFLGKGAFDKKSGRINLRQEDFIANVIAAAAGHKGGLGGEDDEDLGLIGRSAAKGGMGFGRRSIKVFRAARQEWNEAKDAGKSDAEAKAAVLASMKKATEATYSQDAMEKDFADIMKTSAEQFGQAVNQLKTEVGEALVPVLQELVPVLKQVTPPLAAFLKGMLEIAGWAANHPFASFAGLIVASFAKELAAAKIGDVITRAVTQSVAGAGPNGVGGLGGAANGGASIAEMGLIGLGSAVQVAGIANLADETYGAISSGKGAAEAIAKDWNSDDPKKRGAARYAYSQAEDLQGKTEGSTALAWADRASKMAMWVANPFGAAAALGGEWLGDKAGAAASKATGGAGVGTSASKLAVEALKANEIVNAPELQKLVTASIAAGVQEGVQKGVSSVADPSNPKRGQSVTKRTGE